MIFNRDEMPDDVKKAYKKLSKNQRKYCEELIVDGNQTRSVMAAYPKMKSRRAASVLASKMVTNGNIQKYFSWLREQQQIFMDRELEIRVEKTLKKIAAVAYQDSSDLFTDDWHLKNKNELNENQRRMVIGVDNIEEVMLEDEGETVIKRKVRVRVKDQIKALELLGKYHGIFTEKRILVDDNPVTPEEDKAFMEELKKSHGLEKKTESRETVSKPKKPKKKKRH